MASSTSTINTSSPHIFVTGVSGYIGGSVFHHLHSSPHFKSATFTVLIRDTPANAAAIAKLRQMPNVQVELGDHHQADHVQRLVKAADVIVHTAESADDMPSAKAITAALSEGGKRRLYIHTSGTGILGHGKHDARGEYATPDDEIFTDLDFSRYNSIPDDAIHRDVDKVVIQSAQSHPDDYDCILIAPPTIYGIGSGPGNQLSQQVPTTIRITLATGHPGTVGKGLNRWNGVHIDDLAELFVALVRAGLERKVSTIAQGGGLFFAETGGFVWGDVQRAVGEELVKRGLVKGEFKEWTSEESEKYGGKSVWMALASNSRCKSERAAKEGIEWNPKHINAVLSTIPSDIDEVLKRQEKEKSKQ